MNTQELIDKAAQQAFEEETEKIKAIILPKINRILDKHNLKLLNINIAWEHSSVKIKE